MQNSSFMRRLRKSWSRSLFGDRAAAAPNRVRRGDAGCPGWNVWRIGDCSRRSRRRPCSTRWMFPRRPTAMGIPGLCIRLPSSRLIRSIRTGKCRSSPTRTPSGDIIVQGAYTVNGGQPGRPSVSPPSSPIPRRSTRKSRLPRPAAPRSRSTGSKISTLRTPSMTTTIGRARFAWRNSPSLPERRSVPLPRQRRSSRAFFTPGHRLPPVPRSRGSTPRSRWIVTSRASPIQRPAPLQTDPTVDPVTGQGNVYVAWNTNVPPPTPTVPVNFNPNQILVSGSSDGAKSFSAPTIVDTYATPYFTATIGQRDTTPSMVISQGTSSSATGSTVSGGELTIVYDDFGRGQIRKLVDQQRGELADVPFLAFRCELRRDFRRGGPGQWRTAHHAARPRFR